jgi:hypothetical protein
MNVFAQSPKGKISILFEKLFNNFIINFEKTVPVTGAMNSYFVPKLSKLDSAGEWMVLVTDIMEMGLVG